MQTHTSHIHHTLQAVLLISCPRSEGWPHHGRTFSIYHCPLSFWLTLPRGVLSTSWCCPSRPCVVFVACVHLALTLALSFTPGNSLVSSRCDRSMLASLHARRHNNVVCSYRRVLWTALYTGGQESCYAAAAVSRQGTETGRRRWDKGAGQVGELASATRTHLDGPRGAQSDTWISHVTYSTRVLSTWQWRRQAAKTGKSLQVQRQVSLVRCRCISS